MTMLAEPTTAPTIDGPTAMVQFVLDLVDVTKVHGRVAKIRPLDDPIPPTEGVRIDAVPITGDRGAAIHIDSGHLWVQAVYSSFTQNWA